MLFHQIIILALIQGLTEFLPISSSAHLLLPTTLFSWEDQGLAFDLALHLGTLIAVLWYFKRDIGFMIVSCFSAIKNRALDQHARLALLIVLATVPAVFIGYFVKDYVELYLRHILVIASASIFFGLVLAWCDRRAKVLIDLDQISMRHSLLIGLSQALAFIPGTSRSGITITTALYLGYTRQAALRFSFLLSIPIILAGTLLSALDISQAPENTELWFNAGIGAVIAGLSAYLSIHFFIKLVDTLGMLPFVIYRVTLGLILIGFYVQLH